ncbi:MAG: sensor histidine kinase, partial [Alphaproteobacteria bacterium]
MALGDRIEERRQAGGDAAIVLMDDTGGVAGYDPQLPPLLGVADEDDAVASALAPLSAAVREGETAAVGHALPGFVAERVRLSRGGWVVTLRRLVPEGYWPDGAPTRHERLLREILDSIDASVVVYDSEERYVFGNRGFHEIYPNHPDDARLVGRTFEHLVRLTIAQNIYVEPEAYTDPEGFVQQRLAEFRVTDEAVSERRLPSGRWHLLRRVRTDSGLRVTLRVDITEQKRLQQQLADTSERLRLVSEAKSHLLAGVSHDLRTPLNAIIGFADMMRHEIFGPLGARRYVDYAGDILRSGEHLLSLIDNLLDLGKAEAGALRLHVEPIDLVRFLPDELRMFEPEARRRGVPVIWRPAPALPALVADPRALRQMLFNLISNALKFTATGAIEVTAALRGDGGIDIAVSDTGSGIPVEALERIGEPFY